MVMQPLLLHTVWQTVDAAETPTVTEGVARPGNNLKIKMKTPGSQAIELQLALMDLAPKVSMRRQSTSLERSKALLCLLAPHPAAFSKPAYQKVSPWAGAICTVQRWTETNSD